MIRFFVDPEKGQWLGGYVPSLFRGYPFHLDKDGNLCVDEASGLINDTEGEMIYTPDGRFFEPVAAVYDFLKQTEANRKATDSAVKALADAGLIMPWPLKASANGQQIPVSDLYRIDDAGLNKVDSGTLTTLQRTQGLPLAYAQLFSMSNISHFDKLDKVRKQMAKPQEPNIQQLFGDNEPLKF